ncbi:MAG: PAS domain-containing protein [Hyphomonadaceae bacterium JAD_PAG50586_4]|nr:MAG: PAS domain-containing protein [Hyphomonadaceae bacterium JAD_PAG50586_4]
MPSSTPPRGIEASNALAQAIVDTVREPLIVLDADLRVIVASRSFYRDFQVDPKDTIGKRLSELGDGQWDLPSFDVFLERAKSEAGVVEDYEVEREFPGIGHRVMLLNVRKLVDEHSAGSVLIAIEDVTERRAIERERDELLRQKELLLEEMQHRVSNSLQIIASILLMKARAVSSEETRTHLHDAHKRVLAVAAVQKHLHASVGGEPIQLEPYLIQLCASLGGAMIPEGKDAIVMTVHVSGGRATSGVAVSLGLIITELVINALKHAFPVQKTGNLIHVAYDADDPNWALSVTDNGVGKAHLSLVDEKGGLGTSIVSALASQLDARVMTMSGDNGTSVSILHGELKAA